MKPIDLSIKMPTVNVQAPTVNANVNLNAGGNMSAGGNFNASVNV